jgi:hypothetical protein
MSLNFEETIQRIMQKMQKYFKTHYLLNFEETLKLIIMNTIQRIMQKLKAENVPKLRRF